MHNSMLPRALLKDMPPMKTFSSFHPGPALKGALFVLAGAFAISFSPLFIKMDDTGPSAVAFYRLFWGGLALTLTAILRGERIIPGAAMFRTMALAALFFSGDLIYWHFSILRVGPGLATILSNFQVFFLAIFGVLYFKERITWKLAVSIPLALAGLWLLLDVDLRHLPREVAIGILFGLLSALFYTGYILALRRSQSASDQGRLSAVANMGIISLVGAVFVGIATVAQGEQLIVTNPASQLILLTYGIGCQSIGWLLLSKGLPLLPASRAGLLMLTQPALSFVWDVLLFDRPTSFLGYCGAAGALLAISLGVLDSSASKTKQN